MSIYITHRRRKTSNALDTLVLSEQECFQWTSERLVTTCRIAEVSRQRIPSRWSSDNEGPTTKWAELVTRHKTLVTTGTAWSLSTGDGTNAQVTVSGQWCPGNFGCDRQNAVGVTMGILMIPAEPDFSIFKVPQIKMTWVDKKLSYRRETARCFVSLNISLSHSKVIRNDTPWVARV